MYMTLVDNHQVKRAPFFCNMNRQSCNSVSCELHFQSRTQTHKFEQRLLPKTTVQILLYSGLLAPQILVIKNQKIQSERKNSFLFLPHQLQFALMLPNHQLLCLVSSNYQKYSSLIAATLSSNIKQLRARPLRCFLNSVVLNFQKKNAAKFCEADQQLHWQSLDYLPFLLLLCPAPTLDILRPTRRTQ